MIPNSISHTVKGLLLLVLFVSCSQERQIHTFEGRTMGTYYSVKISTEKEVNKKDLGAEINAYLKYLNSIFSTYQEDSELSRLNRAQAQKAINISSELKEVLLTSKEIYKKSEGYFDVTVGPIVNAWGFGPGKEKEKPAREELEDLKTKVGMDLFEIGGDGSFVKKEKDLYIDLSAIAKGYGVDRLLNFLKGKGFDSLLVEIGGETRTLGKKAKGEPWLIGIERPSPKLGNSIQTVVKLNDQAIATSGSYRNFVKHGDEVFSHTIDPTTGEPARNKLISVSVIAPTCAVADAYATAMLAMGQEKALLLAQKVDLPAFFLVKNDSKFDIIMTDSFKNYQQEI